MNETEPVFCTCCGQAISAEEVNYVDDDPVCPDCMGQTVACSRCGELIWSSDNAGTDALPLCGACREAHYTQCSRCGELIRLSDANYIDGDDEEALCYGCYQCEMEDEDCIHAYSYKPSPLFYGEGPRWLGVELEMDDGGKDVRHAKRLLEIGNAEQELFYIKTDGSLEDGLEVVSHPCSLAFHLQEAPWKALLEQAIHLGYHGHQTDTAGLHVHVSRTALGSTPEEQDEAIGNILFFVEKHWDELLVFSRRTPKQLDRWAARYGYADHPRKLLNCAKDSSIGRYACVNLLCPETIEFRIFRSTLRLNTVFACLELVDAICDMAISLSEEEMKDLSWQAFVLGLDPVARPELIKYLRIKRLYVNEPVLVQEREW